MFRLLGALLLMSSLTGLGFFFAGRLKLRSDFLGAMLTLSDSLKTEIRYSRDDIMTIIKRSSPEVIARFALDTDDPRQFKAQFISSIPRSYRLTDEDKRLSGELFSKLGTTDVEGQISHLELCGEKLRKSYYNSLEEIKSKTRLYRLLGFFAGAAAAVTVL